MSEEKTLTIIPDGEASFITAVNGVIQSTKPGYTNFQIVNFIMNDTDFPTPASKYHQSVLELNARKESIISMQYEHDKLGLSIRKDQVHLDEINNQKSSPLGEIEVEELELEICNKTRKMEFLRRRASGVIDEMKTFLKCSSEAAKITPENQKTDGIPSKEKSQVDFWTKRQAIAQATGAKNTPFGRPIMSPEQARNIMSQVYGIKVPGMMKGASIEDSNNSGSLEVKEGC